MLDYHRFCQMKDLHERQGLNASQMAQAVARDRRTVAYWLPHAHVRPRQPRPHARKLDPFKPDMVRWLERHPSSAAQVFPRLREAGFASRYGLVKAAGRTVRPTRQPAFLTLAFAPGACAQGAWGAFGAVPVGQPHRPLSVFVMVLCDSRMLYVEFPVSQTLAHFLACHHHACDCFGGLPHHVMVDNLTSAVLKRAVGEAPGLTPTSLDFATHHGFPLAPCTVGKGKAQGRVENGVGAVKKPCLAGLEPPDFSALNPAARDWLDTVAKVRLHGETRAPPTVLWHTERPALRPVPLQPCDIATVSQVRASRQLRVTVEPNRSAVPAQYAGHAWTLQTSPDRWGLSLGEPLLARHVRRDDRHTEVADPDHPKALLEQRQKARDHKLFRRFLALSPRPEAYSLQLEARRLTPHHHGRTMVALSDIYAPEAVARAMEEALVSEAFSSDYMAHLVEQRARGTPEASALHLTRRSDRLDVSLAPPDLRLYSTTRQPPAADTQEGHPHG